MEIVHDGVSGSLSSGAKLQHRDEFGEGVEHHPQPEDVRSAAQSCAKFVKLKVREMEMAKPAVMQRRAVLASPRQPGGARALAMPEHAHGCSEREPFGQYTQDFCDSCGWRLEAIEGRITAGGEGRAAGLAAKGLDALALAMRAVADKGVALCIIDAAVEAGWVGTGEAVGGDTFRRAAPALQVAPRAHGWRQCGCRPDGLPSSGGTIIRRARFEQTREGSTLGRLVVTPMVQTGDQPQRREDQDDDQCVDVFAHRASMLQSAVLVREQRKDESRGGGSQPIRAGDRIVHDG